MPSFNKTSKTRLATCDRRLQRLFDEVIQHYDVSILCGYRDKDEQTEAFESGRSKVHWPNSMHNHHPSLAVDVAPYPIDWENTNRFFYLAGLVEGIAAMMGVKVRFGGDWDSDKDFSDQKFNDLVHFEIAI